MNHRRLAIVAVLLLLGTAWWALTRTGRDAARTEEDFPRPQIRQPDQETLRDLPARPAGREEVARLLALAADGMRRGNPGETERMLDLLESLLGSGNSDPAAAIAAILEFLRGGRDAPTGLGFVIADGGRLAEATTLRVYLMDKLGTLSRDTGGAAALAAARETLRDFGSADEWAVSMRNVAWFDPASREFLRERVHAMLHHRGWRDQPSTGMLEAFDLIVHTGALEAVPELGRLVSTPGSPLARASNVALDRLAASHAQDLTSLLNQHPDLLATVPLMRAGLFARADPGDPDQRRQLEIYLLRADVDASERRKFLSSLVQSGRFVSHNLVTPQIKPETSTEAGSRLETLTRTVNQWMRDDRFQPLADDLATLGNTVNRILDEIDADPK